LKGFYMNKWILAFVLFLSSVIRADNTSSLAHAIMHLGVDEVRMLLSSTHLSPEQTEQLVKFTEHRVKAKASMAAFKDLFWFISGAAGCMYSAARSYDIGKTLSPSGDYFSSEFWQFGEDRFSPERTSLLKTLGWGGASCIGLCWLLAGLDGSSSGEMRLKGQQIILMLLGKPQ
jgi:hypothetical protein